LQRTPCRSTRYDFVVCVFCFVLPCPAAVWDPHGFGRGR
jgi:hypothetical protein